MKILSIEEQIKVVRRKIISIRALKAHTKQHKKQKREAILDEKKKLQNLLNKL